MKKNYESVYRMKLTGYQVRTTIGILNERRLKMKAEGYATETISPTIVIARAIFPIRVLILDHFFVERLQRLSYAMRASLDIFSNGTYIRGRCALRK